MALRGIQSGAMLERRPPTPGSPTAFADGSEADDVPFGSLQPSVGIRDWLLGEGARIVYEKPFGASPEGFR